jgi:hypothetical protein
MSDIVLKLRSMDDPVCQEAANKIADLERLTKSLPHDLGDLSEIPEELLLEMSVSFHVTDLDDQIVTVINCYGGEATLDQILVGLYRKFRVVQKRRFLQNKLYRQETVRSVEGRKGIYSTDLSSSPRVEPKEPKE